MAISNIFGSNALLIGLFLLAEIAHRGGLIIEAVDESVLFSAGQSIAVTTIYIWVSWNDAILSCCAWVSTQPWVLATYVGGLVVLYSLRP